MKHANVAVELEIEKLKALDAPVIMMTEKQVVVRRNSDGTEVEVGKRLGKGHYSEQVTGEDVPLKGLCKRKDLFSGVWVRKNSE